MVNADKNKEVYTADGVTRYWAIPAEMSISDASELVLYVTDSNGSTAAITESYKVDLANKRVEYPTVVSGLDLVTAGYKVTLNREPDFTQTVNLRNQGGFPAPSLEGMADKAMKLLQYLKEQVSRCIKSDISSTTEYNLPDKVTDKLLGWGADGLENKTVGELGALVKASDAEAVAGTDDNKFMTPATTKAAGDAWSSALLSAMNIGNLIDTATFEVASEKISIKAGGLATEKYADNSVTTVKLESGAAAPGNSKYYGTDGSGAKGFHTLPAGITDHGALTGLSDDDHAQYLNSTRHSSVSHTESMIAASAITQSRLKTASGEVSTTASGNFTLPGADYGLWPQIRVTNPAGVTDSEFLLGRSTTMGSTYVNNIYIYAGAGGSPTASARQRYITGSGIDYWIFLLLDKQSGNLLSTYNAPDHPCYGNGGDIDALPHPFGSYDPQKHDIRLLDIDSVRLLQTRARGNAINNMKRIMGLPDATEDVLRGKFARRVMIDALASEEDALRTELTRKSASPQRKARLQAELAQIEQERLLVYEDADANYEHALQRHISIAEAIHQECELVGRDLPYQPLHTGLFEGADPVRIPKLPDFIKVTDMRLKGGT